MGRTAAGRLTRRWGTLVPAALALALVGGPAARATVPEREPVRAVAEAPPPAAPPLAVAVRSDWAAVKPEAVRQAVEQELQVWVVNVDADAALPPYASRLVVEVAPARGVLSVRYEHPGRKPLQRVIPVPSSGEAALRTIAWLAGNLVRDQAWDLLPAPEAAAPVATPLPPPPPAAAPAPLEPAGAVPSVIVQARPAAADPRGETPATISLFFPIASNESQPAVRTHLSANVIYGRIGTLDGGLQLGTANQVTGDLRGLQLGALFNWVGGDVQGAQLAPVNSTRGQVEGTQLGLVNRAGDVRGAQIGLVNVGHNVHGLQLGLVNVSDDVDGIPIGLINVSRTGGVHPVVWTSGTTQLAVGLKFSTRQVYTLFSAATQPSNGSRVYGPGLAVGYRVPIWRVALETDVGGTYLFGGPLAGVSRMDGLKDDMALVSWRVLAGIQAFRHLTAFGGVALTTRFRFYQVSGQDLSYELGPDLFAGVQL